MNEDTAATSSMIEEPPLISEQHKVRLRECWSVTLDETPVALRWAPNMHALTAAPAEGEIVLIDAGDGSVNQRWPGHQGGNLTLEWHPELPRFATGGCDGLVKVWAQDEAHPLITLEAGKGWVEHVQWSGGHPQISAKLAASCGRDVYVWGASYATERKFRSHATVLDLQWNPALGLLMTTHRTGLQIWVPEETDQPHDIDYAGAVLTVRWSPCSRMFAMGNHDATVSVIQLATMKCLRLGGFGGKVAHLAWEPSSRSFAGAGGEAISVWDLKGAAEDNQLALPLIGHIGTITAMAWQPLGVLLASGGTDARLILWHPQEEILPVHFRSLPAPITQIAWARDGRHLAVGTRDGRVTLYNLE